MPKFFDYPQVIQAELESMGYEVDFYDDRPSTKGIVKAVIRVNKKLINGYIKKYFSKMMDEISTQRYDVVLLISGQSLSFSEEMIAEIKKKQPQARFVLYQWDSLKNFQYILKMHPFFEKKYSFDKADCKRYPDLRFLPLFYSRKYENIGANTPEQYQYDFSFVGTAHPKKYKFIKKMSEELSRVYPKQFIYFFFPSRIVYYYRKLKNSELKHAKKEEFHFTPLKGKEMDEIIRTSRCIMDSPQEGQLGLTIRVLEALGAKKKLITTNEDVKNYDFYCKENIYVYKEGFDFNSSFFQQPYKVLEKNVYEKYALRNWLAELLS